MFLNCNSFSEIACNLVRCAEPTLIDLARMGILHLAFSPVFAKQSAGSLQPVLLIKAQSVGAGTAGLRGKVGPGFNRMNRVTVQQSIQGLCAYLEAMVRHAALYFTSLPQLMRDRCQGRETLPFSYYGQFAGAPGHVRACKDGSNNLRPPHQAPAQLATAGVAIGYDGRRQSREFAELAAGVLLARGIPVHLFSRMVPTPFVPLTVSLLVRTRCIRLAQCILSVCPWWAGVSRPSI
jgi:Phosphoglucomutase/phosphomannomutase, alpha/beta/alpha domain I